MEFLLKPFDSFGKVVVKNIIYSYNIFLMAYFSIRAAIIDKAQGFRTIFSVISAQVYFTGWQAMPIITVMSLASGAIVIMQTSMNLSLLGGKEMIGNLLIILVVRELGPLVTSLVVIARSGTAVASEVGNMRANREIEALESMGINPLSYIVFPRLIGGIISVICLSFYFNVIALFGGFIISRFIQDMSWSFYTDSLARAMAKEDVLLFLVKNLFSGTAIFVISCYQGLSVKRSPHEVPMVTTAAVMNSIIYVTTFNLVVSGLFYVNQFIKLGVI